MIVFWIYVCSLDLCLVDFGFLLRCLVVFGFWISCFGLESLLSLEVQRLDITIFEPGILILYARSADLALKGGILSRVGAFPLHLISRSPFFSSLQLSTLYYTLTIIL
jgi:hypothetical protein